MELAFGFAAGAPDSCRLGQMYFQNRGGAFLRELDQIATEPVAFLVDRHLRAALFAHIGQNS